MKFFSNQCFDPTCRHVSGMILFGIQGGCFGYTNVVVAMCLYLYRMSDLCFELPPKETDYIYNNNKEWNNQHSNNHTYPNNSKNYHNNHHNNNSNTPFEINFPEYSQLLQNDLNKHFQTKIAKELPKQFPEPLSVGTLDIGNFAISNAANALQASQKFPKIFSGRVKVGNLLPDLIAEIN